MSDDGKSPEGYIEIGGHRFPLLGPAEFVFDEEVAFGPTSEIRFIETPEEFLEMFGPIHGFAKTHNTPQTADNREQE